ncbi:MAG: hypothetical protein B7Z73_11890, partial [Planctomycetia bacterium 21-64-5]
ERLLHDVKAIQEQQKSIIRDVVHRFNIRSVYVEGLVADNPAVRDFLAAVRSGDHNLQAAAKTNARLRKYLDKEFGKSRVAFGMARSPNYTALFKARRGAPAALFLSGELPDIEPVEDSLALRDAATMSADGRLYTSRDAMELREDAMVGNMLKGKMPALIVLGAGHDLEENIKRASGESCDYIRIQSNRCWAERNEWALQGLTRREGQMKGTGKAPVKSGGE